MTIGEMLQVNNPSIYMKLKQIGKEKPNKKEIKLGDSVENLMKADSHKRVRGALRQRSWG